MSHRSRGVLIRHQNPTQKEPVVATESSPDDVVDVLVSDHREIVGLIEQISATRDEEQQRLMRNQLIAELVRHSVAEEMHVYPAMKKHLPNGKEVVEHDKQEHSEIERTLKELEDAQPTDVRFMQLISRLRSLVDDHVRDEELEQFPQLRGNLPSSELLSLADKVRHAKKLAPTRPHPNAPNQKLFHQLVGPGVGLVDRLRDKLSGRSD